MKMNYFLFGTNDMRRSIAFYDAFFEGSGTNKIYSEGRMTLWANGEFMFGIVEPFDGEDATNGNGTMLGLNVDSSEEVERLYKKALDLGGASEGEPGMRSGRYAAYVRDLDKNKICLYVM
ncbi:VOC family protein [Aquisalimonas asiatica]|uniref:Predicted lactoylglutathione lyase n=1 Tax=Aquisalimonas asiatica TaxID=406100 RepID=A0A1H8TDN2_9GAMM|nr:VOC family protein [Aquisalimonas asiatica]SEO89220.1 Predicted lactoylglutathione lyase [Aquisalimonas asiatica]